MRGYYILRMKKTLNYNLKDKFTTLLPLFLFMGLYLFWFQALEQMSGVRYHVIYTPMDGMIPFCEYFIIPYFAWFLFIPAAVLYLLFEDEHAYHKLSGILMFGRLFFLISSPIYPSILYLRPVEMPADNIFCDMVRVLYQNDTPTNVTPSIHVFNTLAATVALNTSSTRLAKSSVFRTCTSILAVAIVLSTLFLRQHSILDVVAAVVLLLVVQAAAEYIYSNVTVRQRESETSTAKEWSL